MARLFRLACWTKRVGWLGYFGRTAHVIGTAVRDPTRKSSERWVVKGLSHSLSDPRQFDILLSAIVIWSTRAPIPVCYADNWRAHFTGC